MFLANNAVLLPRSPKY